MKTLNQEIKAAIKVQGENAPAHFGFKKLTLERYMKKGLYPAKLMEQVIAERQFMGELPPSDSQPAPEVSPPPKQKTGMVSDARLTLIENYLQGTVDACFRYFDESIKTLRQQIQQLQAEHLRHLGMPSLARPDQNAALGQTFTTNLNAHPLDSGNAPTKAQVDAQANMYTQFGVPVPGAEVAGPATQAPGIPAFGYDWNKPRPR